MKPDTGIAIVLAWPQTLCKQTGSWYDAPLRVLGINKSGYYKVGHSAIVLIDTKSGKCHYYDFGRYHAPVGHGRVRSALTDHELELDVRANISENNRLENYDEILGALLYNESCHGSGTLHASYCGVDFESARQKADSMQLNSPMPYGPFVPQGTNCSRFVNAVLMAGKPEWHLRLRLAFPASFTPTPIGNVKVIDYYVSIDVTHPYMLQSARLANNPKPRYNEAVRSVY